MIVKNVKLNWVSVTTPNGMSGKYQTDFYMENPKDLLEQIDNTWESHKGSFKGKPQSLGYTEILNENGEGTGEIKFKATQAPQSNDGKYTFKVEVYDAKAKKCKPVPSIGNGTIANVDIEIFPYTFKQNKGVKLNLKAIQILDLVEYGGGSSFEAQEEGFVAEPDNNFNPEV